MIHEFTPTYTNSDLLVWCRVVWFGGLLFPRKGGSKNSHELTRNKTHSFGDISPFRRVNRGEAQPADLSSSLAAPGSNRRATP